MSVYCLAVCVVGLGVGGAGDSLKVSRTWLPFLPLPLPVPQVCKARSSSLATKRGYGRGEDNF